MEDTAARDLIVSIVRQHADSLLRVARRHTDCAADAEDAYQRALEIFVRNAGRLDPDTAHKWLHTVVKHESHEVRRQRSRLVAVAEERELDALDDGRYLVSVEERSERFEELTRAAEALRRCKPAEVTALVLKAQGLSYAEIAERQGWTYTKVNRCLTEGRRAFLSSYARIASGEECARWSPVLSRMADGEASARDVLEARPHLRNCPACRASLAEMQRVPAAAAALVPLPLALGGAGGGLLARISELFTASAVKAQSAIEAVTATKAAAVGASVVAMAGGGVAVQQSTAGEPRPEAVAERAAEPGPAPAPLPVPAERTGPPAPPAPPAAPGPAAPAPERDAPAEPEQPPAGDEFSPVPAAEPQVIAPSPPEPEAPRPTERPAAASAAGEFGFER